MFGIILNSHLSSMLGLKVHEDIIMQTGNIYLYLHFHCESLNEPLHLRCGSYLHEQIDLSHTHLRAI